MLIIVFVLVGYVASYIEARHSGSIFFGEWGTTGRFGGKPRYSALLGHRSDALGHRATDLFLPAIAVEKYLRSKTTLLVDEEHKRDVAAQMDRFVAHLQDEVRRVEQTDATDDAARRR